MCECSIVAFLSPTTTRPKAQPNPKPTPFRKSGPNEFVPRTDNRPATMDLLFFLLGECPNGSTSLNKGLNRCSPPHVMGGACAPKPPGTYRFLERNRRKRPPFEISHRPGRRNPFIVNATAPINSTPPPPPLRACGAAPSSLRTDLVCWKDLSLSDPIPEQTSKKSYPSPSACGVASWNCGRSVK